MIRTTKRLRLCAAFLIGILGFIWGNSLLPAEISQAFSDWVKALLFPAAGGEMQTGSGLLRKIAHFTEFTALGAVLCWLFGMLEKKIYWPFLLGFGAACVDETIQRFSPGRSPALQDVAIDTAGVAVGIGLLMTGYYLLRKRKQFIFWRKTTHEETDRTADGSVHGGYDGCLHHRQHRNSRN